MSEIRSGEGAPSAERGSVHTLLEPDRTRVVLSGEVDVALDTEFTEAVAEAEAAGAPAEVDARHLTFIDSSGMALLARLASRTPGRTMLFDPPEVLRFLLTVTKIGELLEVVTSDAAEKGSQEPPDGVA